MLWLQAASAAEINISPNQLPVILGPYLDHFEDASNEMTLNDILTEDIEWQRSGQVIPTLGFSPATHWFFVEVSSRQMAGSDLLLQLESATLDRADFYFFEAGEMIKHSVTGDTVSFEEFEIPYRIPLVPFALSDNGNSTQIYIRVHSRAGIEMPLTLRTVTSAAESQQSQLTFFGAFFAFFFISFCACAILYYSLRDSKFLGYALFFGAAIPFFLAQTGMGRVWFWGNVASANNRIAFVSATVLIISLCLLGQSLSLTFKYRDSINIVLRYVAFLMLPTALYFLFMPLEQITNSNVMTLMATGFLIAATVCVMTGVTALQGSRAALYLFCSWALVILAYSSMLVYKFLFVERASNSALIGETLVILGGVFLLLSLAELVRAKNEELSQARLESRAKADFLKNVSREFLTPVHLILANSKRLLAAQSSKLDEPTRQHMNTVIKQSDHLHNLINDLLEMAELESESFEPEFELVDMSRFLTEVKDLMLPSAMEKNLDIKTDFAAAKLLVQTDRSRLQHALINLITNGIKYTDKGSITLAHKAVYFRRRLGIEIEIRDTGRGMSEEFQKSMFQEFSREYPGSEKDPQGTGLGMVIVKRMIEKLGGEIDFASTKGEGSQFFIRLPLRAVSE